MRDLFSDVRRRLRLDTISEDLGDSFETQKTTHTASVLAKDLISIRGQNYEAAVQDLPVGARVEVVNTRRAGNAVYAPKSGGGTAIIGGGFRSTGGEGGGGGGGGLTIDDVLALVDTSRGLSALSGKFGINLSATAGLEFDGGGALKVRPNPSGSGLIVDGSGLALAPSVAGDGLTMNGVSRVMAVGAGNGIAVSADAVAVRLAATPGLEFDGGGALRAKVSAGLNLNLTGIVVNESYPFTWWAEHEFKVTPLVDANLKFTGFDREIQATDDLLMKPTGDLFLFPGGDVVLNPTAQFLSDGTQQDLPTGIKGFRLWERPDALDYWQLTIGALKADEIYARAFVADETRIQRGENYISKGFGIVQEDFTLLAVGADMDVWFENSTTIPDGKLFQVGDWVMLRIIDIPSGTIAMKCWFQVQNGGANGYVTMDLANKRQRWRLRRKKFGTTGVVVKRGNTMLDAGVPGNGWIYLAALTEVQGPFIEVGMFTSVVADEPQFTGRTRMGRLSGTVDYSPDVDAWGFVTGNNLGWRPNSTVPGEQFSGMASDSINGLRMFNTALTMYTAGNKKLVLNPLTGLSMLQDTPALDDELRQIGWYDNVDATGVTVARTLVTSHYSDVLAVPRRTLGLYSLIPASVLNNSADIRIEASDGSTFRNAAITLTTRQVVSTGVYGSYMRLFANEVELGNKVYVGGDYGFNSNIGTLHVANSTSGPSGREVGALIEQRGSGDAVLHWYREDNGRYFSAGVQGGLWKLSASHTLGISDFIVIDPSAGTVTINGLVTGGGGGTPPTGLIGGDGIDISGSTISVRADVARTTTLINAGDGLMGGGSLAASRTLAIRLLGVSGLSVSASGLMVDDAIAGDGLQISSKVLRVGAGQGIVVDANTVGLAPTVAGDGLLLSGGVLSVKAAGGLGLFDDTVVLAAGVAGPGLTLANPGVLSVNVGPGLAFTGDAIGLASGVAGGGLTLVGGILAVGGSTSIAVAADSIALAEGAAGNGLILDAGVLHVVGTDGILVAANSVGLNPLVAGNGLTISAGVINVGAGPGIAVTDSQVLLAASAAGAGMTSTTPGVLDVVALSTGGLLVNADSIQIKLTGATGLLTDANGLSIADTLAGGGLLMSVSKNLVVDVDPTLTILSNKVGVNQGGNFVWTGSHSFLGVVNFNTDPQVSADLDFVGAGLRQITAAGALTVNSVGNLVLSSSGTITLGPASLVVLPDAGAFRSATFADTPVAIDGFMLVANAGAHQFTVERIKTNSMVAQSFVADTVRVSRDQQLWSKSSGVVQEAFTVPAESSTVNVWFENAPALGTAPLFVSGDWILFQVIERGSSLVMREAWFQAVTLVTAGTVDGYRQRWSLVYQSGGVSGMVITPGMLGIDVGVVGNGLVHLSASAESGGPYMQIGKVTGVVPVEYPTFTNYVRMGNLKGTVDYGSADVWGFAAGTDLGITPDAGYSGLTVEATNGIRLFNTNLNFFLSGTETLRVNNTQGIRLALGENYVDPERVVAWLDDLNAPMSPGNLPVGVVTSGFRSDYTIQYNMDVTAEATVGIATINLATHRDDIGPLSTHLLMGNQSGLPQVIMGAGYLNTSPTSFLMLENNALTSQAGLTLQQFGIGDAVLRWRISNIGQVFAMGIDQSDGNKLKLSTDVDLELNTRLTVLPSGEVGIATTNPLAPLQVGGDNGGNQMNVVASGAGADIRAMIRMWPKGVPTAGGGRAMIQFYNTDLGADGVNYEFGRVGTLSDAVGLFSGAAGTGTVRPIRLFLTGQAGLYLDAEGNFGFGTTNVEAWDSSWLGINIGAMGGMMATRSNSAGGIYMTENMYFDGAWKRRVTGFAGAVMNLAGGGLAVATVVSGSADVNVGSALTNKFVVRNDGEVFIGAGAVNGHANYQQTHFGSSGGILSIRTGPTTLALTDNGYYDGAWRYKGAAAAAHFSMATGQFGWHNAVSGSAGGAISWSLRMQLDANGYLGIGITPQGILHNDDGTGGQIRGSKTGVNGTAQTILLSGTITRHVTGSVIATDGTTTYVFSVAVGNPSTNPYDVACGSSTLRFASASGNMTVQRISGSATFTITYSFMYM